MSAAAAPARQRPPLRSLDVKHVVPLTLLAQAVREHRLAAAGWVGSGGSAAGCRRQLGGATAVVPNGFLAARLLTPTRDLERHRAMLAVGVDRRDGQARC